jgi:hypothetical protein
LDAAVRGPHDYRDVILHQESSFNFRPIQTQKPRHFNKVQFLVLQAVQSSQSHKCEKNFVSGLSNNKLSAKTLGMLYVTVA